MVAAGQNPFIMIEVRNPNETAATQIIGAYHDWCAFLFSQSNWSGEAFGKSENSLPNPRLIVILVDMSASADQARRTVCKDAFEKVYRTFGTGIDWW